MPVSSPAGAKPEKTMSSRLMTMKFMQRAAATKEASQPEPTEGSGKPSSKRPRLSTDAVPEPSSDLEAISAAIAAEEEKRREAVSRQAAEAGETEWVLDYPGAGETHASQPVVVAADSLDDDDVSYGGRQSYGNFKRKKNTNKYASYNGGQGAGDQTEAMINDVKSEGSKKPKKEPNLSQITSLSGTRQASMGSSNTSQKKRKHT